MTPRVPNSIARGAPAAALLLLAALCCPATHARPVRVYEVDVAERSPTALQEAMRQALVRATGRREAADDPALASLVSDAAKYVQDYTTGPRGEPQVVFNAGAVQQAIIAAGRSIWDSDRPFTLIVLDPPRARAQADAARAELERAAAARGLPVSLVPLALNDAAGKPLSGEALLEAAQHYGADALLVGRGEGATPEAALQWTLYAHNTSESWSGPLAAGIDRTVEQLVPQQTGAALLAESDARIQVENVRSLNDYAALGRLLQATPGVRRASFLAADPTSVEFLVTVRGGAAGLEQALAGQAHLTHSGAAGARALFHYQP